MGFVGEANSVSGEGPRLEPGMIYEVQVRALTADGASPWEGEILEMAVPVPTRTPTPQPPVTPTPSEIYRLRTTRPSTGNCSPKPPR